MVDPQDNSGAWGEMTCYWTDVLPNTPANRAYTIRSYGPVLQANKALLCAAFCKQQSAHAPNPHKLALMMAMAMLETTTMTVSCRDCSKDGLADRSANCSMFNLSEDLLTYIGFRGRFEDLNVASNLVIVVAQIDAGLQRLGVEGFLNFVRGGRTGYLDGTSYGAADYRSTIATILSVMDAHPALLTDDRRVDISLPHV